MFGGKVNKKTSWPVCQATALLRTQGSVSVFGFSAFRFPWLAAMKHGNRPSLSCCLEAFGSEWRWNPAPPRRAGVQEEAEVRRVW